MKMSDSTSCVVGMSIDGRADGTLHDLYLGFFSSRRCHRSVVPSRRLHADCSLILPVTFSHSPAILESKVFCGRGANCGCFCIASIRPCGFGSPTYTRTNVLAASARGIHLRALSLRHARLHCCTLPRNITLLRERCSAVEAWFGCKKKGARSLTPLTDTEFAHST